MVVACRILRQDEEDDQWPRMHVCQTLKVTEDGMMWCSNDRGVQKGAKSMIILTLWRLWKLRNDRVFNRATPNRLELVHSILDEARLWLLAGAKALYCLPLHARPPDA
jgi:hypothetical protein